MIGDETMTSGQYRAATSSPRHILIAEDDEITRELLVNCLSREGATVTAVEDGAAAVQAAAGAPYSLCILDVNMPHMTGLEACRRLRAAPLSAATPILFLTSQTDSVTIDEAFAAGASDFLPKPFHPRLLWNRVSNLLQIAALAGERERLEGVLNALPRPAEA